jgi:hypothetical protein
MWMNVRNHLPDAANKGNSLSAERTKVGKTFILPRQKNL